MMGLRAELQKIRTSTLARNAGWMLMGQGTGFLLQAIYFILIARLLGNFQYGLYAGAFALTTIIGQYSTIGSGTLFLRHVSADPKKFSLYWGNILAVTTTVSVLIIVALSFVSGHILSPGAQSIAVLAAVGNCFCNQLTTCAGQVFQTYERLRITAVLNLSTNFMRTVAALVMFVTMHHASAYQWALAAVTVSMIATIAAVTTVTLKFGKPIFSLRHTIHNLPEGLGFSFATSTSTAYNDIDKTMLSHYGMNVANGVYTMAYRIVDVATIPVLSIREAAMPRFFRHGVEGVKGGTRLAVQLLKRAVPLGLLAMVAVYLAAPLVPRLVGQGFAETVSALRWLCVIPLFRSIHQMTGSAITGAGLQRYRTASQLFAAALNIGLNVWLIPRHGWLGAAWASLLTDGSLAITNSAILAFIYSFAGTQVSESAS